LINSFTNYLENNVSLGGDHVLLLRYYIRHRHVNNKSLIIITLSSNFHAKFSKHKNDVSWNI